MITQTTTQKNATTAVHTKKTLKQRLIRVKENIIRALNKEKWKEQQRLKEMQGKESLRYTVWQLFK